jgi:GNAT superfamily N-acetyltransferase
MTTELTFRLATEDDLIDIVRMLLDVVLDAYLKAFKKIAVDPNQELTVVEMDGEKIATFQLTFIQYLTYQGGLRAQIEAVRTNSKYRGQGIGTKVFEYAINRAKEKGCHLVQLTSDKRRSDAIRFYENMGFVATHEGMKLSLK